MATAALDPVAQGTALSNLLNPLYVQNFKTAMNAVAPGAADAVSANISSLLKGQLPADVLSSLAESSAELNLKQGRFGEAAGMATARSIGTTSLALQQTGLSNLKSIMPTLPDINTLIQQSRAYDVTQQQMDIQQSQFGQSLAEQKSEFNQNTALKTLAMNIQQSQFTAAQAQQQNEFNATLSWDQTLSAMNRNYDTWAQQQKATLAANIAATGAAAQKTQTDTMNSWLNALTGNATGSTTSTPATGTVGTGTPSPGSTTGTANTATTDSTTAVAAMPDASIPDYSAALNSPTVNYNGTEIPVADFLNSIATPQSRPQDDAYAE